MKIYRYWKTGGALDWENAHAYAPGHDIPREILSFFKEWLTPDIQGKYPPRHDVVGYFFSETTKKLWIWWRPASEDSRSECRAVELEGAELEDFVKDGADVYDFLEIKSVSAEAVSENIYFWPEYLGAAAFKYKKGRSVPGTLSKAYFSLFPEASIPQDFKAEFFFKQGSWAHPKINRSRVLVPRLSDSEMQKIEVSAFKEYQRQQAVKKPSLPDEPEDSLQLPSTHEDNSNKIANHGKAEAGSTGSNVPREDSQARADAALASSISQTALNNSQAALGKATRIEETIIKELREQIEELKKELNQLSQDSAKKGRSEKEVVANIATGASVDLQARAEAAQAAAISQSAVKTSEVALAKTTQFQETSIKKWAEQIADLQKQIGKLTSQQSQGTTEHAKASAANAGQAPSHPTPAFVDSQARADAIQAVTTSQSALSVSQSALAKTTELQTTTIKQLSQQLSELKNQVNSIAGQVGGEKGRDIQVAPFLALGVISLLSSLVVFLILDYRIVKTSDALEAATNSITTNITSFRTFMSENPSGQIGEKINTAKEEIKKTYATSVQLKEQTGALSNQIADLKRSNKNDIEGVASEYKGSLSKLTLKYQDFVSGVNTQLQSIDKRLNLLENP